MLTVAIVYGIGFAATFYVSYANEIDHDIVTAKEALLYAATWPFFAAILVIGSSAFVGGWIWRKITKANPFSRRFQE